MSKNTYITFLAVAIIQVSAGPAFFKRPVNIPNLPIIQPALPNLPILNPVLEFSTLPLVDPQALNYAPFLNSPCGCASPTCGCGAPTCGCGASTCNCQVPTSMSLPPAVGCGCNAPVAFNPTCGCGLPTAGLQTVVPGSCGCGLAPLIPPFPPVIGCTKYLRQVCVQPPFL